MCSKLTFPLVMKQSLLLAPGRVDIVGRDLDMVAADDDDDDLVEFLWLALLLLLLLPLPPLPALPATMASLLERPMAARAGTTPPALPPP